MFKINSYFNGKVASIVFRSGQNPASVGVMSVGEYKFGTVERETMTVVDGELSVKLPGSKEWETYAAGESFVVEANGRFEVQVPVETPISASTADRRRRAAPPLNSSRSRAGRPRLLHRTRGA